jgi:hypothetical protein
LLSGTLHEYEELLEREDLREEEMQEFLENNKHLLEPNHRLVLTKGELRKYKMPEADFLVKTSDNKYLLVELEKPGDVLFTNERPPNPSGALRHAESQMRNYLSDIRNRIQNFRDTFAKDISIENLAGRIVIGRSHTMSEEGRKELEKYRFQKDYSIITFDELLERTRAWLENIAFRYGAFAERLAGGGILIKRGSYPLSSPILLDKDNVSARGEP